MTQERRKCIDTKSGQKTAFRIYNIYSPFSKPCFFFPQLAVQLLKVLYPVNEPKPLYLRDLSLVVLPLCYNLLLIFIIRYNSHMTWPVF